MRETADTMTSTLTLPQAPTQINGGSTTGVGITSKGDAADNGSGGSESLCAGGGAGTRLGSNGLPCRGAVLLLDVLKNLGVCVLVLLYLFLGAFMFLAMNGEIWNGGQPVDVTAVATGIRPPNTTDATAISSAHIVALQEQRIRTIDHIWDITVNLNILYRDNWTELAGREIERFQNELLGVLAEERSTGAVRRSRVRPVRWSFAQAFLFSLTVITTIGYGSLTPSTPLGKMATMLYAALGIPLMLLYLSAVGGLLARCARGVFTRALCCCLCSKCGYCCYDERQMQDRERRMRRRRQELEIKLQQMRLQAPYYVSGVAPPPPPPPPRRSSHHEKMDLLSAGWSGPVIAPILLCAAIMIVYVGGGAAALLALRACPFLDCVYFCFMSLTTIGFGRLAPGSSLAPPAADAALWFCSVYILTGMALTTMCCNVIYSVLLHALKHAAKK